MGYFWSPGRIQKLFVGNLIKTNIFCFLSMAQFWLYLGLNVPLQVSRGGLDAGRPDGREVILMPYGPNWSAEAEFRSVELFSQGQVWQYNECLTMKIYV